MIILKKLNFALAVVLALGTGIAFVAAQDSKPADPAPSNAKPAEQSAPENSANSAQGYSGMYTFRKEGEFVQLTVEDDGSVTGFVSRFGDGEQGQFVNQFFKSGRLEGNKLNFTTQNVRGASFDFKGTVNRGEGKNPGDEAYFVLKGKLTETLTDANKKTNSHSQEVALKMFPQDANPAAEPKN
jgi:hypothetical protein